MATSGQRRPERRDLAVMRVPEFGGEQRPERDRQQDAGKGQRPGPSSSPRRRARRRARPAAPAVSATREGEPRFCVRRPSSAPLSNSAAAGAGNRLPARGRDVVKSRTIIEEGTTMAGSLRFHNPKTLAPPPGYSYVVEASGPSRIVYFAGQLGLDTENKFVGAAGDFRAQCAKAFDNMTLALEGGRRRDGATWSRSTISWSASRATWPPSARCATAISTPRRRRPRPPSACRRWRAPAGCSRSRRSR